MPANKITDKNYRNEPKPQGSWHSSTLAVKISELLAQQDTIYHFSGKTNAVFEQ